MVLVVAQVDPCDSRGVDLADGKYRLADAFGRCGSAKAVINFVKESQRRGGTRLAFLLRGVRHIEASRKRFLTLARRSAKFGGLLVSDAGFHGELG